MWWHPVRFGVYGVVFDPVYQVRHSELRDLMAERSFDAILDPRTQELGSAGGFNRRLSELPWALDRPHRPEDFGDVSARRVADRMAQFVREERYGAVLAPTHYIQSANSPWLDVDARLTMMLRQYLDRAGAGNVPIFYSLAVSYDVFRSADERGAIIERLADLPVECLWMKISQSGALTHTAVRNLVKGAAEFHSLRVPLIGDMMGGWRGLSALAFGAVGGICHGATQKEVFNASSLTRPANGGKKGFTWPTRTYVTPLGVHLKKDEATAFFAARGSKSRFGCRVKECCPKSWKDMLDNPVRHSLVQAFSGGAAAQQRSRTAPRTPLSGRNRPARDGRGCVLGVAVVRRAGAPGKADEREQEVPGASSHRLGEIRGGEPGGVDFADTPASGGAGLSGSSRVTD